MQPAGRSLALFTDMYELTMAQAYWHSGTVAPATFSLFFRRLPTDRGYFIFAGLHDGMRHLDSLRFTGPDIQFLRSLGQFDDGFLDYLAGLRFTGNLRAMPEGIPFFADEPVLEVTAPIIEAQIVETYLLNQVNLQTMLATKATRAVHVSKGAALVDFSARRTHGTDAADKLARVSYLAGFGGTSNLHAAAMYGIPAFGTMAHSFITAFDDEAEAFRAYARSFPDTSTLLVDTYDTIHGTRNAIQVALELQTKGHRLRAIRLDSGDLSTLAKRTRQMLDEAGLRDVQVFASGGIDEFEIERLHAAGAPLNGFGVGTRVGVSEDAPYTDCAYKLVEYAGRPVLKLSTGKETMSGPKQVYRLRGDRGQFTCDVIAAADEPPPSADAVPLLTELMRHGRPLSAPPDLTDLRVRFAEQIGYLPDRYKALRSPAVYEVTISPTLRSRQQLAIRQAQTGMADPDR